MRLLALFIACAVLLGASAVYCQYIRARQVAEWSAAKAMHERIVTSLEEHRTRVGRYPSSLQELKLDFRNSDGATPETLGKFEYELRGDSYELALPPPG